MSSTVPVAHDYQHNLRMQQYKTFAFFEDIESCRDPYTSKIIESSIAERLTMLGLDYNATSPDLIVAYSIHENKMILKSYKHPLHPKEYCFKEHVHPLCQQTLYRLKEGTIMVQLIEQSTMKSVWRGFSISDFNQQILNDERLLEYATIRIIEQCRIFTNPSYESMHLATN